MTPRIEILPEKKLIGTHLSMSLADNKTGELWRSFMPRRKEINNATGHDLYSIQVYNDSYFKHFNLHHTFVKWAAIEVNDFDIIPEGLEAFTLPGGMYAVFTHKGPASTGAATFQYIFNAWLPGSGYVLDERPHFELLGATYKNDDPDSEEEFWIPVKIKKA